MLPFKPDMFQDRTVVITGCGRGIGLAVATAFAACGARVLAHSGRRGTAAALSGVAEAVCEYDFTQPAELDAFTRWVAERSGRVDVLVNNAGTMFGRYPADALDLDDYDKIVALNQTAVVRVTGGLIPLLRKSKSGAIVNTVSISATTGGSPGSSIYSATKAFVATYTKALARELAPDGIRANAVSPGTIDTDFHDALFVCGEAGGGTKVHSVGKARHGAGLRCRIPVSRPPRNCRIHHRADTGDQRRPVDRLIDQGVPIKKARDYPGPFSLA